MKNALIVFAILAVLLGLSYNSMIKPSNEVDKAWNDLQTQYQRRYDVIDQLVSTVKGAANFEKSTLTDVINARASASKVTIDPTNLTPEKMKEIQNAQGTLSQALGKLMVVSEQYPSLKTSQNFLDLQAQIEGTENRVAKYREEFNSKVLGFNNAISTFPRNLVAGLFGFKSKSGFVADDASQKAPKIDFGK